MSAERHAADTVVHVRDADDALVREVALVHARARAAEYLVREDPAAAARALRGLTRSSGAVFDALRATARPQSAYGVADAVALAGLLGGFRASGGSVRFAASGPEGQLSPHGESAVRSLLGEVLAAGDGAGSLSVTLTWSPEDLDVLVVLGPHPGRASVTAGDLVRSWELVQTAGGSLRVESPSAGGTVVAATLPVPGRVGARIGP